MKRKVHLGHSEYVDALDKALDAAEKQLRSLLEESTPSEIADSFARHIATHLQTEMENISDHDNKDDN